MKSVKRTLKITAAAYGMSVLDITGPYAMSGPLAEPQQRGLLLKYSVSCRGGRSGCLGPARYRPRELY
eukprot:1981007-Rhodomonas_salina.5